MYFFILSYLGVFGYSVPPTSRQEDNVSRLFRLRNGEVIMPRYSFTTLSPLTALTLFFSVSAHE